MLAVSYNNNDDSLSTEKCIYNIWSFNKKKIQSSLTYDVAIESSTNIATVGGKQKQVKQYKLYNTYNLKSVILTQYFRPIVGKKPNWNLN